MRSETPNTFDHGAFLSLDRLTHGPWIAKSALELGLQICLVKWVKFVSMQSSAAVKIRPS